MKKTRKNKSVEKQTVLEKDYTLFYDEPLPQGIGHSSKMTHDPGWKLEVQSV